MSQIDNYKARLNSEAEGRNPAYLGFLDSMGIDTLVGDEHRIIEEDHAFSNFNNNVDNNNDGQIYRELGNMNDDNIYVYENKEDNYLFDIYEKEINDEGNEFQKELSELFKESNEIQER